ncbi:helix-turn-helix transcriptional regulator [Arundinibacter roseus]|uniref:Response regulator transcription factor n=1 Tax=Arundinibacter roseus TaxID=2070510 RepID=A0A4R4KD46_9BACT|nr:LuxR C-terminal-related transcriptional regulator [Arundinibacter roseus]TDB65814.1 response regulator transcription factor [Arundinibacter roseus]
MHMFTLLPNPLPTTAAAFVEHAGRFVQSSPQRLTQAHLPDTCPQLLLLGADCLACPDARSWLTRFSTAYRVIFSLEAPTPELLLEADAVLHPLDDPCVVDACLSAYRRQMPYVSAVHVPGLTQLMTRLRLLSTREWQIFMHLRKDTPSAQIAHRLCISEDTVKNHRKAIRKKLGLQGGKNRLMHFAKLYELHQQLVPEEVREIND